MRAMCAQTSRPAAVRSAMFAKGKAGVYDPNDARVKPGAKRPGLKLTYEPHTKEAKAARKAAKKAVAATPKKAGPALSASKIDLPQKTKKVVGTPLF